MKVAKLRLSVLLFSLVAMLLVAVLAACASSDNGGDPGNSDNVDVTITIVNQGASEWLVTDDGGAGVAELNVGNADWTLATGKRYRIVNQGGAAHPFELLDENDVTLLAQGERGGKFEGDTEVAYLEDDQGITFTLDEELANALSTYVCSVHSAMRGSVTVSE